MNVIDGCGDDNTSGVEFVPHRFPYKEEVRFLSSNPHTRLLRTIQ
jgi:hypothetical protein